MKINLSNQARDALMAMSRATARDIRDFLRGTLIRFVHESYPASIKINDQGRRYVSLRSYAVVYRVTDDCLWVDQIWPEV